MFVLHPLPSCLRIIDNLAIPLLAIYLKIENIRLHKNLYGNADSSMSHKNQNVEITQMSIHAKWINKKWSMHTLQYYSGMRGREALTLTTMWTDLENTMVSERSRTRGATQCVIPFT